jgi:hypothetical protein
LWPLAARKPGDHAFGTTVMVHRSVEERRVAGERRYRLERLMRRSDYADLRYCLGVKAVDDLAIPDAAYSSEDEKTRSTSSAVDTA